MYILHRKFIAVLLSLMLGLLPLQGVFAGEVSMPMHESMVAASMNDTMSHEQASEMSPGCDQCEQDDCCSGSSCDVHHCASCAFAAVLAETTAMPPLPAAAHLPAFDSRVRSFTLSSLYRPPRV
jgi:hypothetical protein